MNITDARLYVRSAARDAGGSSSVYDATAVDQAILEAGDHFCRWTRYTKVSDSVTITEDSTSFPTTTPQTKGFLPERIIDVWITGEETPLELIEYPALAIAAARDTGTGVPRALSFLTSTGNGTLWPTPDDGYTAVLRYWQPFGVTVSTVYQQGWTPGTATAGTLAGTINLPDDVLRPVLTLGAAGILKAPSPEEGYEVMKRGAFAEFVARMKGTGNLGSRVIYREKSVAFQSEPAWPGDRPGVDG